MLSHLLLQPHCLFLSLKHPKHSLINSIFNAQTGHIMVFCIFLRAFPSVRMSSHNCVPDYSAFKTGVKCHSVYGDCFCLISRGQMPPPLCSQAWSIHLCCDGLFPKMITIIPPIPQNFL